MKELTVSQWIASPPQRVFDLFTDLAHASERIEGITNIELLTDGSVGLGTRWRETRMMFGREATEVMEIVEFVREKSYTVACDSCGVHYECQFRFTPERNGTQVKMTVRTRPLTLFAKLMSPIGSLMAGTMKKYFQKDLDDLKRYMEGPSPAAACAPT